MKRYRPFWQHREYAKRRWTPAQVRYIHNRDGGHCIFCGQSASEIHHVIPCRHGGQTITSNGVAVCHSCNMHEVREPDDVTFLTRAIFWLESHGEDTSWMDECYSDNTTTLTDD